MSDTEMTPEPDWLAAEPTARAKLTAIMAAVARCFMECPISDASEASGPHMSTSMAEVFIGQLMAKAAEPALRCPTSCDADCEQACHEVHQVRSHQDHDPTVCVATLLTAAQAEGAEAERQHIASLARERGAIYIGDGHSHPFADLLREDQ